MAVNPVLEHPLFFNEWKLVHKKIHDSQKRWDDESFGFLDEILEEAKKQFSRPDVFLLPKTPSAKRKRGRKKKSSLSCNEGSPATSAENETGDDLNEPVKKSKGLSQTRSTRATRAASRATKASSKKEPVQKLFDNVGDYINDETETETSGTTVSKSIPNRLAKTSTESCKSEAANEPMDISTDSVDATKKDIKTKKVLDAQTAAESRSEHSNVEESFIEITEEWTQMADNGKLDPSYAIDTPLKTVIECHKIEKSKTPIQHFSQMNVKEKVQAYEDIVLISPVNCGNKVKSAESTPAVKEATAKTPDTVVIKKTMSALTPTNESEGVMETDTIEEQSKHGDTPRRSTCGKKSFRESLRTSLHILPSKEKEMKHHNEVPNKPIRTRTRLRLKKTENSEQNESGREEEVSSSQEMDTDSQGTESSAEVDTAYHSESSREKSSSEEEIAKADKPKAVASTRTKTRHVSKKDNTASTETTGESTEEESTSPQHKPVRSTRTKTRTQQAEMSSSSVEREHHKDSGIGSRVTSQSEDLRPRATRSKMRKPTVTEDTNDNVLTSPPVQSERTTRTKTRKRQLEGSPDDNSRRSKRSCTGSVSDDQNRTPTTCPSADKSSDDEDTPTATKVVKVPSFLNKLKPLNNPLRPAGITNGGMVKSFIARSSPKPTAKEIREKQRKELLEKQMKNEERLKKRDDEYKKKMEEMRKKREEKMKKAQQLREQKKQEEQKNRQQLEKRLAEKRQLTNKVKEERLKDEKEKHRMRMQKFEEAEERRKQEEAERKKKLMEQMKNEKSHEAFMQRKKEYEEQERQRKIEEEKQKAQDRQLELEREREKERDRLKQLEEEKQREWQKKKEEREKLIAQEKAEREKQELERKRERELQLKAEMERIREQERLRLHEQEKLKEQQKKQDEEIKKMVDKHNNQIAQGLPKPNLNKTHSINEPTVQQPRCNSYEMTPDKVPAISDNPENYGIDDLNSGDETDDEDAPRKEIPSWAQGSHLKTLLIKQHYNPPDLDKLFDYIEIPDLNILFEKKRARFNKRTSSAHWDTPILKPATMGNY